MTSPIPNILSSFLGEIKKHSESNYQLAYNCPACDENREKGNLEVNYNLGVYQCWACADTNDMKGPIPKLIKKYGNPKILKEYLLYKPEEVTKDTDKITHSISNLPKEFIPLSKKGSKLDYKYNKAINYLKDRNITSDIIKYYNIGYCPEGEYAGRIIIPSYDEFGTINYFTARSYINSKIKYKNPKADKKEIIYNEGKISWDSTLYIVEGPFDHIVLPNSVPLLGKYIQDKLLNKIKEKLNANIVIILDDDAIEDAERLYQKLNTGIRDKEKRVKMVYMPKDYDISKINEEYGRKGVMKIIKTARHLKF
jgi:DNA primase